MPLLPNINVGSAPNDGTGDTIRNAFIKVNENFQFIEAFFPNTDVANLTANITSTGTSTFNNINVATVGNTGTVFTGTSINAATIGNTGATLTGSTVNAATIGNTGATLTGSTVNAATIGNTGSALVGATVSAATIGNTGSSLSGTITTNTQPNIDSIGAQGSNLTILSNLTLNSGLVTNVRSIQKNVFLINSASGSYNIGLTSTNSEFIAFHMSANVTLSFVGTVGAGYSKDFYFLNNTGGTLYANIFAYGNRTNKGTNSIAVSSNTVALVNILATDTNLSNVVAIISNT